jgi:hypothetical protein
MADKPLNCRENAQTWCGVRASEAFVPALGVRGAVPRARAQRAAAAALLNRAEQVCVRCGAAGLSAARCGEQAERRLGSQAGGRAGRQQRRRRRQEQQREGKQKRDGGADRSGGGAAVGGGGEKKGRLPPPVPPCWAAAAAAARTHRASEREQAESGSAESWCAAAAGRVPPDEAAAAARRALAATHPRRCTHAPGRARTRVQECRVASPDPSAGP